MEAIQRRQRRRALHERLTARVPRWYSPIPHLAGSLLLTASIIFIFASQLRDTPIRWWTWFALPVALFLGNVVEYLIHRYPMHHRTRWGDRFFRSHTLVHHRVFDHCDFQLKSLREAYFVLTTVHTTAITLAILGASFAILRLMVGADLAVLTCVGFAIYALAVEVAHLVLHFPDAWFARWPLRSRLMLYLREHHRIHHDPKVMTRSNFNLAFPVTDFLAGTRHLQAGASLDEELEADAAHLEAR